MTTYDAIIVGARCAGAPLAMLLARKGYRVLAVDRASFPSDTVSTHVVQPLAAQALARWRLLERLRATGCPPIHTYSYDFGGFSLAGAPGTASLPMAYCPRRTILDKLLVDGAREAGAEVRERFSVDGLLTEAGRVVGIRGRAQGGAPVSERARVVVGADGRHSIVARAVRPAQYNEKAPLQACYYTYWSGLPMDGRFATYIRPRRGFAAVQTHDGLTLVVAGWPYAEFDANKRHIESSYMKVLGLVPGFAERVAHARREARFAGAAVANFFRKPYGAGWVLVGDAGYNRDPITAQGIHDAFRDAEACAEALHASWSGAPRLDDAMAAYQRSRDERVLPMYEFTCQLAALEPPPAQVQRLLGDIQGDQGAMDAFAQLNAGTLAPAAFFARAATMARNAA